MPVSFPAANYEVSYHMTLDQKQPAVVTMGVAYIGTDFAGEKGSVATAFFGVMAELSSHVRLEFVRMRNNIGTTDEFDTNVGGGDTDPAVPDNVAFLIRKVTGQPGRRARGRWFLPGVGKNAVGAGGAIGATKKSELQTAVDGYMLALSQAHFLTVLLHTYEPPTAPPASTEVTSMIVDPLVATQRRRLRD